MKIEFPATRITLAADQFVKLDEAVGVRLVSRCGSIWITQDGDSRDIVLEAGDSFVLDRAGPSIVQALGPAVRAIAEPVRPRRAGGLADRLKSFASAARLALAAAPARALQAGRA